MKYYVHFVRRFDNNFGKMSIPSTKFRVADKDYKSFCKFVCDTYKNRYTLIDRLFYKPVIEDEYKREHIVFGSKKIFLKTVAYFIIGIPVVMSAYILKCLCYTPHKIFLAIK